MKNQAEKENQKDFGEIMAAPSAMSRLSLVMAAVRPEKVKQIAEALEGEKVKIILTAERNDHQRKRKLEVSLNECENRIAKVASKRSKQVMVFDRVAETARLLIDTLTDCIKGSTITKEMADLKEIGEAFVQSEANVVDENMKLLESVLDGLFARNSEVINDILEKSPVLAEEKDSFAALGPAEQKDKEVAWKLKLVRVAGKTDPLKEDQERADQKRQELVQQLTRNDEEFAAKENIMMDLINKVNLLNEKEIFAEEKEIEELRKEFENDRQEGHEVIFKINSITMDKQNELIELREKISEMKEVAGEKAQWQEKLEEAETCYNDAATDCDCIFTEFDEEQKEQTELSNLIHSEEFQIKEDEEEQEMRFAEIFHQQEEMEKELQAIRRELNEKIAADELSDINLKSLQANLDQINEEIDRIQGGKKQKRERKRAKKRQLQELENEFAIVLG